MCLHSLSKLVSDLRMLVALVDEVADQLTKHVLFSEEEENVMGKLEEMVLDKVKEKVHDKYKSQPVSDNGKSPSKKKEKILAIDFVPVWQNAEHLYEVADHFGKTMQWANRKARDLRQIGVSLKRHKSSYAEKRIDVDELNAVIEE